MSVTISKLWPEDQAKLLARIAELEALLRECEEGLEPFVSGAGHTMTFLRTREKMHPTGQELYLEDIRRARTLAAKLRDLGR
jgi:hypothetical protein